MRTAAVDRTFPLTRALLLGTGLAAAWVVVSLVASPSSASADERPDGLLGAVGSVVGVVDDTVDGVVAQVVDPMPEPVPDPVATTVDAVTGAAPAPVAPVVEQVAEPIDALVPAAAGVVDAVDDTVAEVVDGTASVVSDVASDRPVGTITTPVVDTLDGVVGALPIVGSVLDDDTLSGVLGPVVGVVDDTLDVVVGDLGPLPDDGLLPSLPVPGDPGDPVVVVPPGAPGDATATDATAGRAAIDSGATSAVPPGDAVTAASIAALDAGPPGASPGTLAPANPPRGAEAPLGSGAPGSGSSASGSGSGTASGSDAGLGAIELDALASLVLSAVDDELPSSPVHDTDTTPD
ncbi:hypothetical protein [Agromyces binzhouensis]|uniref:hypothetical protein n=1 Tax=Agromyces binzhouensis TaxID=1817495 RepID=UPI003628A6A1